MPLVGLVAGGAGAWGVEVGAVSEAASGAAGCSEAAAGGWCALCASAPSCAKASSGEAESVPLATRMLLRKALICQRVLGPERAQVVAAVLGRAATARRRDASLTRSGRASVSSLTRGPSRGTDRTVPEIARVRDGGSVADAFPFAITKQVGIRRSFFRVDQLIAHDAMPIAACSISGQAAPPHPSCLLLCIRPQGAPGLRRTGRDLLRRAHSGSRGSRIRHRRDRSARAAS